MLTDPDLKTLVTAGLIDTSKAKEIAVFLQQRRTAYPASFAVPHFDLTHVLWYAGALIVIGAMGLFTNEAFNRMGGGALVACGLAYAAVFVAAGHMLWKKDSQRIPAGLLITVAVSMVPMIIYGVQDALGLWAYALGDPGQYKSFFSYVNGSWIYMEVGSIVAAALAVWRYPFAFILLLAAVALWFMSMDVAPWLTREPGNYYSFDMRRLVSLYFGIGMILLAWAVDILRRRGPDFAFWLHIFGVMTFWGAMTLSESSSELAKFFYCLINVSMIGLSLFLNRRVYAVFGAIGVAAYLGYLASEVFQDAILFSFALSAIGLGIIALGLLLHRSRARLVSAVDRVIPARLHWLRPEHARAAA